MLFSTRIQQCVIVLWPVSIHLVPDTLCISNFLSSASMIRLSSFPCLFSSWCFLCAPSHLMVLECPRQMRQATLMCIFDSLLVWKTLLTLPLLTIDAAEMFWSMSCRHGSKEGIWLRTRGMLNVLTQEYVRDLRSTFTKKTAQDDDDDNLYNRYYISLPRDSFVSPPRFRDENMIMLLKDIKKYSLVKLFMQ